MHHNGKYYTGSFYTEQKEEALVKSKKEIFSIAETWLDQNIQKIQDS